MPHYDKPILTQVLFDAIPGKGKTIGTSKGTGINQLSHCKGDNTNKNNQYNTLNEIVSQIAKVLSAPIVISWGAPPITLDSSTAVTPPSWA